MTARHKRKTISQMSVIFENNSNPQFTSNNQFIKGSNITISSKPLHLQDQNQVKVMDDSTTKEFFFFIKTQLVVIKKEMETNLRHFSTFKNLLIESMI